MAARMRTHSLFSRLRSLVAGHSLRRQVARIERALLSTEGGERAVLLSRLCDLHLELEDQRTAASCLGAAIDACLTAGHLESAASLCRKMLGHFPGVVRAHGTLGFLLLSRGNHREAERELAHYLGASLNDGTAGYAAERIRMTAPAFPEAEARILLERLLRHAGNIAAADEIAGLPDRDLTAPAQRRLLSTLLRRSVRAHLLRPGDEPATISLGGREPFGEDAAAHALPLLDTSILRGTASRAAAAEAAVVKRDDCDDLPWMDTTLPLPVSSHVTPVPAAATPREPKPAPRTRATRRRGAAPESLPAS
jgi:hypothetical protein